MEMWTKGAVEKMSMLLKVSMTETESGAAAKKRTRAKDKTPRKKVRPRTGRMDAAKKSKWARYNSRL